MRMGMSSGARIRVRDVWLSRRCDALFCAPIMETIVLQWIQGDDMLIVWLWVLYISRP